MKKELNENWFGCSSEGAIREVVDVLIEHYSRLREACKAETDRLERISDSIAGSAQTVFGDFDSKSDDRRPFRTLALHDDPGAETATTVGSCQGSRSPLGGQTDKSNSLRLLVETFGVLPTFRSDGPAEFEALELSEYRIRNYLAQMRELESEIATAPVNSVSGALAKLRFMSGLAKEGLDSAKDVLPFVLEATLSHIESRLKAVSPD